MNKDPFSDNKLEEEPKLIIDEDWKTQVQREKEQLRKQKEAEAAQSAPPSDSSEPLAEADPQPASTNQRDFAPPPASFEYLISGLATQAIGALGQLPDEQNNPLPVNLDFAKHYINLLGVIETKTQGNLNDHETRFLQDAMHQLRMLYVEISKQTNKAPAP